MKKNLFFVALAALALASCSDDTFVGENSPNLGSANGDGSIQFSYSAPNATRADAYGKDAATKLSNHFTVGGFKGAGNVTAGTKVFDNYLVQWTANTAGTTASNTSDWEYVGITAVAPSGVAGQTQTIKYWDYSAAQYDFIAYSTGAAAAVTTAPSTNEVQVTAFDAANATTAAYTLKGTADDLAKCYVADMVSVYKDGTDGRHYQEEVPLTFRSLSTKVRIALYETIPGYSVKGVEFYHNDGDPITTNISTNTAATLFTTGTSDKDNFFTEGTFTVKFPTVGKAKVGNSDYNKAHVVFAKTDAGSLSTTKDFGALNYTAGEAALSGSSIYLGRTSNTASYAGTAGNHYYTIALPNEEGAVLELRVNYTLVANDGSGEEIHVYGAKAFVPAIYATWKPNYAYTYIFKISDNSNGWTSQVATDPQGLYPITFDAVVLDSEEDTQSTITTVATPSITTYQKGHDVSKDEYAAGADIYVQVMEAGALKADLNSKGALYTITGTAPVTEANVMDALNIRSNTGASPINGRNGMILTTASKTDGFNTIPGADGNNIEITANTAAKFTPSATTNYAYVYDTGTYAGDYYPVEPTDFPTGYYTDAACTTDASTFSAGTYYRKQSTIVTYVTLSSDPGDFDQNIYYAESDPNCVGSPVAAYAAGNYYKKITVNHNVYGVKVIRIQ